MAFKIYPVLKTEDSIQDYSVKINGIPVLLDTARVSAVPFNRRWPGHQRSKDQSELINFLSLSFDEPVTFEITPLKPFESVVIRPLTLSIQPEITDGVIRFTMDRPAYFTVEPYGRNHALHIFADELPNYDVDKDGEDVLYFGPGEHDVGQITLHSNQTLFIDEGAVVYACIHAIDAENIRMLGRGILDNSRNKEIIHFEYNAENNDMAINNADRQHTVQLEYCSNILIDGITIRDSLVYNIRPVGCNDMQIRNVKIIGCWRYNSDGIDMHNCRNVLIDNCFLRTFDDSICVKGFDCYYEGDVEAAVKAAMYRNGKAYDTFVNTTVKNCTIWNDWGKCLEIGAETRAEEICNIVFENCDIIHVTGPVLDCCNVDYADVHDIVYRDIHVEYDDIIPPCLIQKNDAETYPVPSVSANPPLIMAVTFFHPEYSAGGTRRGINRNILFQNIHLTGPHKPMLTFFGCDEEHKTKDITVENICWNGTLLESVPDEQISLGDFTENIRYCAPYAQMQKNTVSSKDQLKASDLVRLYNPEGKGKRVMFVGNSITLHGYAPQIGWYHEWGMAASAEDKDYVHCLMASILETDPDAAFCICQVADWERLYKTGKETYHLFTAARDFKPDILVMRFVENCPGVDFEPAVFKQELADLLTYLTSDQNTDIIMTTGFWHHPADPTIEALAAEKGLPLIKMGDLGDRDDMKAIGLYPHEGVAQHPGDLGMKTMADRIFEVMKQHL